MNNLSAYNLSTPQNRVQDSVKHCLSTSPRPKRSLSPSAPSRFHATPFLAPPSPLSSSVSYLTSPLKNCSIALEPTSPIMAKTNSVKNQHLQPAPFARNEEFFSLSPAQSIQEQNDSLESPLKNNTSIEEPDENPFAIDPEASTVNQYGSSSNHTNPKTPQAPQSHCKSRRPLGFVATDQMRKNRLRFKAAKRKWSRKLATCPYINEGNFHTVLLKNGAEVCKLPNAKEQTNSRYAELAFQRAAYAEQDYNNLQALQEAGGFPDLFRLAKTRFKVHTATIIQEKCDRLFHPDDLQNPEVLETLKSLFQTGFQGVHNIDLKADNLGWKKGKLVLIDFREQNEEDAGAFYTNIENFLKTFACGNKTIYEYLDPRPKTSQKSDPQATPTHKNKRAFISPSVPFDLPYGTDEDKSWPASFFRREEEDKELEERRPKKTRHAAANGL